MGILDVSHFAFSYPGDEGRSLTDISFSVQEGEFFVLCGTSGCGKSTLLRNLKPPLRPEGDTSGEILYRGKPIWELDERIQSAEIGYVLQNPDNQIVTEKVWHELAFGLESLGYDTPTIQLRVSEMASYFGLGTWFYRNVNELSGGQKQLLNLASIMALHPSILILDEPTSQLDPITASDFLGTIKKINQELGVTIIITEHRLEDIIPVADQVAVMDKGRLIVKGTSTEVGRALKRMDHPMFQAMPAPMQIHEEVETVEAKIPMTVRTGRQWLSRRFEGRTDIRQMEIPEKKKEKKNPVFEFKDVWFRYEQDLPDIVKGLNLQLYPGELYCLLGGNGVGKSTALSLMCRVHHPYRGKIEVNGKNIKKVSDRELFHGMLGVVPQNPQSLFVKKTVEEELFEMIGGRKNGKSEEYDADMSKEEAVAGFATLVHLEHRLQHHPYDLSGGEQQRLALAKVLLLKPKLLLMDEPTKGMDRAFKAELAGVFAKLKDHGVSIFMISHDLEFCAMYADRCGLFFDGRIVHSTTPREFFTGNNFYTTSSNRMARHIFPNAITAKDVITCCRINL